MPSWGVRGALIGALLLEPACGSGSGLGSTPSPEPAPPSSNEAAPVEPVPAPGEPVPEPPSPGADVVEPVATPSTLRLVAAREGAMHLLTSREAAFVMLEGEPVPWEGGRFERQPEYGRGLAATLEPPDMEIATVALVGSLGESSEAWLSTMAESDWGTTYETHHWTGERWRPLAQGKGPLHAFYPAMVESGDTLWAVRRWFHPGNLEIHEGVPDPPPHIERARRALKKARLSWVRLAGSEAVTPVLPPKAASIEAVSTSDGAILALTRRTKSAPYTLLAWSPGTAEPATVSVPDLEHARAVHLTTSGDRALLYGKTKQDGRNQSYLAVSAETGWERIAIELGERRDPGIALAGAARTADGALWVALRSRRGRKSEPQPVWRKPVDAPWQPVPLPEIPANTFGPSPTWVYDLALDEWIEAKRRRLPAKGPRVLSLVGTSNAVWVTLDMGLAYSDLKQWMQMNSPRTVVLSTEVTAEPPATLPPMWQTQLERMNEASSGETVGRGRCTAITARLGPVGSEDRVREQVAALRVLELPGNDHVREIYQGQLDGRTELVARFGVATPAQAAKAKDALAVAAGNAVTLDCRVPLRLKGVLSP